jgi:hypothetical protein
MDKVVLPERVAVIQVIDDEGVTGTSYQVCVLFDLYQTQGTSRITPASNLCGCLGYETKVTVV